MENLWRYYISIECLQTGGIVVASGISAAIAKVMCFYKDDRLTPQNVQVWNATTDDDYDQENPDVLLVY
jgi:hypothetical protein